MEYARRSWGRSSLGQGFDSPHLHYDKGLAERRALCRFDGHVAAKNAYFLKYFLGIGLSGRSASQYTVTTHQRLPSLSN